MIPLNPPPRVEVSRGEGRQVGSLHREPGNTVHCVPTVRKERWNLVR